MQLKDVCTAVLVNTPMSSTCRISCLSDLKPSPSNNAIATVEHSRRCPHMQLGII